jgi:hypothetical protein
MALVLYRDCYRDICDEWQPGSSWSGETRVQDSTCPFMRVYLRVRVYGRYPRRQDDLDLFPSGRRCRPHKWSAQLRVQEVTRNVASGRCRSLKDVSRQVEALDLAPHVRALLGAFYSPERAACVYRPGGGRWETLAQDGWTPWATSFSSWTDHESRWPAGEYMVVEPTYVRHVRNSSFYSSGSSPETRDVGKLLPDWCRRAA